MYFFVCAIAASVSVARLRERRETIGGQLLLRRIRQRPVEEIRRPGKLLSARDAVEVARVGDKRIARRDVRRCAGEPRNDLLPRAGDVGLGRALGAGDGQVEKLRVDRRDDGHRWPGGILLIGFVDKVLPLIPDKLRAEQLGVVHIHQRRALKRY